MVYYIATANLLSYQWLSVEKVMLVCRSLISKDRLHEVPFASVSFHSSFSLNGSVCI